MASITPLKAPARHNQWYEKLLLNPFVGHLVALGVLLVGAQFIGYGRWVADSTQAITLGILALTYAICAYPSSHIAKFPGGRSLAYCMGIAITSIAVIMAVVMILRLPYARRTLFIGMSLVLILQFSSVWINRRFRHLKFAVVPGGYANRQPPKSDHFHWRMLSKPDFQGSRFDGLLVDMDADIGSEWIRFVTHASITGTPVIDAQLIYEALDGKVDLDNFSNNDLVALQPSPAYMPVKRLVDILICVALLPVALPLSLAVAIAIKLDSPGPALFVQSRVKEGNRRFSMYKFRSMREREDKEARFADKDAHRITRLGAFLRRYRLDELPQLLNVLKGDMSLIGPRPEQPDFVHQFDAEVPFYSYRHSVRPGISGWAQVSQGYTADTESTREKVEHDLYYIKHLSPWLDLLITLKTIKTICTGFGAK